MTLSKTNRFPIRSLFGVITFPRNIVLSNQNIQTRNVEYINSRFSKHLSLSQGTQNAHFDSLEQGQEIF